MTDRLRDQVAIVTGASGPPDGWGNEKAPAGHIGDAWDAAHAVLFLASDEARYINGTSLVVDGGLSATMNI